MEPTCIIEDPVSRVIQRVSALKYELTLPCYFEEDPYLTATEIDLLAS